MLVAFRIPPALAERLDALASALSTPWHEMKRTELARVAMERGLSALERELPGAGTEPPPAQGERADAPAAPSPPSPGAVPSPSPNPRRTA